MGCGQSHGMGCSPALSSLQAPARFGYSILASSPMSDKLLGNKTHPSRKNDGAFIPRVFIQPVIREFPYVLIPQHRGIASIQPDDIRATKVGGKLTEFVEIEFRCFMFLRYNKQQMLGCRPSLTILPL